MTGTECYHAALNLLGETPNTGVYYEQFALGALNQLLANSLREINAQRTAQHEPELTVPPRLSALDEELPADDCLAAECFPYGLAALLVADDDKAKSQKNKNRRRIQSGAVCASAGRIRRDGRNLVLEAEKEERGVKKIRDFIKMKGFVTVV